MVGVAVVGTTMVGVVVVGTTMVGGSLNGAGKMASLCSFKPPLLSAPEDGPLGGAWHCGNTTGPFALPVQERPMCALVPSRVTVPLLQPCHLLQPKSRNPLCGAAHHLCTPRRRADQPLFLHLQEVFPMEFDPAEHLCK